MKFNSVSSAFLRTVIATGLLSIVAMQATHAADADTTPVNTTPKKAHSLKKLNVKKSNIQHAVAVTAEADEDGVVPVITESAANEYSCELSNNVTVYTNASDNDHIALRWKQKLYRLKRVDTSTGANRFENHKSGLVWIGIPTKGMLLDSHRGQQLANECKSHDQLAGMPAAIVLASKHS